MYASRTLSQAETGYAQIEREALAIFFAVQKFHQYLYGREFVLVTDHRPLCTIFGHDQAIPSLAAARMQRWALILSAYQYTIQYIVYRGFQFCSKRSKRLMILWQLIG